jgi:hypothetical protein
MNPFTDIHNPLANAVRARLTTKLGKIDDTSTTSDSAATRSRKSHIIHVENAGIVGWKLASQ